MPVRLPLENQAADRAAWLYQVSIPAVQIMSLDKTQSDILHKVYSCTVYPVWLL